MILWPKYYEDRKLRSCAQISPLKLQMSSFEQFMKGLDYNCFSIYVYPISKRSSFLIFVTGILPNFVAGFIPAFFSRYFFIFVTNFFITSLPTFLTTSLPSFLPTS